MSIYRHNSKTEKAENTICVRRGKVQRTWIHALAVMLFCMILSIGTVVFADEVPATVIVAGAKIRATADTSSEALAGVKSGDTLSICGQTTGADGNIWYQVYVNADTKGFIRSDLVKKNTDGSIATVANENTNANASSTTTTVDTSETQVTAVDKKTGTVVTNNVRIRKGASTQHDVVATANKGMVLTVTGEAAGADGKKWYQVSFSYNNKEITGFIRADLVTFDSVSPDTAVSEITGTEEIPEEATTEAVTEEVTEEATEPVTEEQPQEPEDENANMILMNVEEEVYVLPEFTEIILKWQDQDIKAYKNGSFYLFYAQKQSGETGWFLYDSENGVYQRYVYDTADATIPEGSNVLGNSFVLIILAIVIVILIAVIGLMLLKLREYTAGYYDDEYDDDDNESEDDEDENYEDDEELEEEEEEPIPQPVRRPERTQQPRRQPQQENGQPVRRQPQQGNGQQPARRQPKQENVEQPRRQPQQGNGQPPRRQPQQENGQPVRRQPQQGNSQPPRRQPGEPQPKRPTQQQNRPNKGNQNQQLQNGRRAKNFLDADDDDMEFIDI